jgi:hypothetical protein
MMTNNSIKQYYITVIGVTAISIFLLFFNSSFIVAHFYMLPMSIAIILSSNMRMDSIPAFFVVILIIDLIIYGIVFLPILFGPKFKNNLQFFMIQIFLLALYIIISAIVFAKTGSWTSV